MLATCLQLTRGGVWDGKNVLARSPQKQILWQDPENFLKLTRHYIYCRPYMTHTNPRQSSPSRHVSMINPQLTLPNALKKSKKPKRKCQKLKKPKTSCSSPLPKKKNRKIQTTHHRTNFFKFHPFKIFPFEEKQRVATQGGRKTKDQLPRKFPNIFMERERE